MKRVLFFIPLLWISLSCTKTLSPEEQTLAQLKQEVEQDLKENILPFWTTHSPDPAGGFYGVLNFDGTPQPDAQKGGILNARLLWTYSSACRILKDERYKTLADRAQQYFVDHFIDKEYGGSYYALNADGSPLATQKNTYQNAFAIYGLSEHYRATGKEESLRAAIEIYNKLVEHSFDPEHKGFFEGCSREWEKDQRYLSKTMNTNLHVLEALTNLYRVWKDPGLYQQLKDQIDVMQHKILDQSTGHEILYLSADWTPTGTRIDSYGHDIEYSWLLVEAAEVLGDEEILHETQRIAVNVADVQIKEGLAPEGYIRGEKFYGERPSVPGRTPETRHRLEWWPQAEAVVGFVNAWQISGEKKFLDAALLAWEWTKTHMIDHEYGEWYGNVFEDGSPRKDFVKADGWRCPYHNSRMGFELISRFPSIAVSSRETETGFQPVNPQATPETQQLLHFLYSLQGKYILTGQHNFASDLPRYDNVVHEMTGKYPALWGCDFSFMAQGDNIARFQHCGPMNLTVPFEPCALNGRTKEELRQGIVDEAIRKHAEGRVITLMWHCCFPTGCDECNGDDIWRLADRLPSQEEWNELVTNGTELNALWKKQMDGVAGYLKQLQAAEVPVLWRPFHEMNGVWFWWCNKPGDNGFKKLWIAMYDYFTHHHKLNNLLWVWNTNAPRNIPGDEAGPYQDFFPGTEYVDVLAADVYNRDWKQSHHDELLELGGGKLIALGEVGEAPSVEITRTQPSWSWFMVWGYCIYDFSFFANPSEALPTSNPAVKAIYDNPGSITLDRIDFSGKTYKLRNP